MIGLARYITACGARWARSSAAGKMTRHFI